MAIQIRKAILLVLAALTLAACAHHRDPYNDPGAQRERSQGAQDEMRRDTSRY